MLEALKIGLLASQEKLNELNKLIETGEATDTTLTEVEELTNNIAAYEANIAKLEAKAEENRLEQEKVAAQEKAENDAKIAAANKAMEDMKNGTTGDEGEGKEPETNDAKSKVSKDMKDLSEIKLDKAGENLAGIIEGGIKSLGLVNSSIKDELKNDPDVVKNALKKIVVNSMTRIEERLQKNGISIKEGAGAKLINKDSIIDVIMADRCMSDEFLGCIPLQNIIASGDFKDSKSWKKTIRDARSLVDDWTDLAFDNQCDASDYCAPCENQSMQIQIVYKCFYGSCYTNSMAQCLSSMQLVTMSINTLTQNLVDTLIFAILRDDSDSVNNVNGSDLPNALDPAVDRPAIREACQENHWLRYPRRRIPGGGYIYRNPAVTKDSPRGLLATAVKGPLYCNADGNFVYGTRTVLDAKTKLQETDLNSLIRSVDCGDRSNIKIFVNDCAEEQFEDMECFKCNQYLIANNNGEIVDVPKVYKGVEIKNLKHLPDRVTVDGTISTVCDDNDHCLILIVNFNRLYLGYPCATKNKRTEGVKGTNVEIAGAGAYGLNDAPINDKPAVCAMVVDRKDPDNVKDTGEETPTTGTSPKNCVKNNQKHEASELRIVSTVKNTLKALGIESEEDVKAKAKEDTKADAEAKKAEAKAKAKADAEAKKNG